MNGPGDLVIETRALTKRYADSIVAVDDLDLGVRFFVHAARHMAAA